MPTYDFVHTAGDGKQEIIEGMFPISKVPEYIRRKDPATGKIKRYKLAAFGINPTAFNAEAVKVSAHQYPHVDYTLPAQDLGGGTDAGGHPIITSQAHERQVMAKLGLRRD